MTGLRVGALSGLAVGIGVVLVLTAVSMVKAPEGTGWEVEYFLTYALLFGMPLSMPMSLLAQLIPGNSGWIVLLVLISSLIGNWILIGILVAFVVKIIHGK